MKLKKFLNLLYPDTKVIVPLPDVHLVEGDATGVKSERGLGVFGSSGA